jgi:hypothetical protein
MAVAATPTPSMPLELPLAAIAEQSMIGRSPKPMASTPQPASISSPQSSMKEKNAKAAQLRDNAVTMQLTKTKMCAFFERGKCASTNCRYAHSAAELRLAPNLQKTKLCRAFLSGGCNDENCFFAHGEGDLRVTEGIYKTQICNFFERGYCKKGDRCNHAHGIQDLRPPTPTAMTPLGKTSPSSSQGESVRPRRSPLPLSELLVSDSEANINLSPAYNTIPPTPTKSITELAQLAFSPVHSSPLWGQYAGMHPLSPMGPLGAMNDVTAMWAPRDAVDMLVQDPQIHSPTSLMYTMEMETSAELLERQLPTMAHLTPQKNLEMLALHPSPLHCPAPGLDLSGSTLSAAAQSAYSASSHSSPPGLEPSNPSPEARDPLMVNLSERLASLDAVVLGLGNDIASLKSDPNKKLHRI